MLSILVEKGHLARRKQGREVVYRPKEEPQSAGRDAFRRVLIVRHPLDRFLSAFYNLKHYRPGVGMHGPGKQVRTAITHAFNLSHLRELDVEQFARFVTNRTISGAHYDDRHFNSYSRTCRVCDVNYNYVMRTETLQQDLAPLLRELGFSEDYVTSLRLSDHTRPTTANKRLLKELEDLEPTTLAALENRYALDAHLFGYSFDQYVAGCGSGVWHCC